MDEEGTKTVEVLKNSLFGALDSFCSSEGYETINPLSARDSDDAELSARKESPSPLETISEEEPPPRLVSSAPGGGGSDCGEDDPLPVRTVQPLDLDLVNSLKLVDDVEVTARDTGTILISFQPSRALPYLKIISVRSMRKVVLDEMKNTDFKLKTRGEWLVPTKDLLERRRKSMPDTQAVLHQSNTPITTTTSTTPTSLLSSPPSPPSNATNSITSPSTGSQELNTTTTTTTTSTNPSTPPTKKVGPPPPPRNAGLRGSGMLSGMNSVSDYGFSHHVAALATLRAGSFAKALNRTGEDGLPIELVSDKGPFRGEIGSLAGNFFSTDKDWKLVVSNECWYRDTFRGRGNYLPFLFIVILFFLFKKTKCKN